MLYWIIAGHVFVSLVIWSVFFFRFRMDREDAKAILPFGLFWSLLLIIHALHHWYVPFLKLNNWYNDRKDKNK